MLNFYIKKKYITDPDTYLLYNNTLFYMNSLVTDDMLVLHDVLLTSCTLNHLNNWDSGIVNLDHYEVLSLRRPQAFFGQYKSAIEDRPIEIELESAYFGGTLLPYYGHFLLESISYLPNVPSDNKPIVFMVLNNTVPKWQLDFFKDIDLLSRLVFTNKYYYIKIRNLYKIDQENTILANISSRFINYTTKLASKYFKNAKYPQDLEKHIYLSRTNIKNAPVYQEEILEEGLQKLGVDIIKPENMSIKEQVALYNQCKTIIAIEGSALHTLIFCNTAKNIISLKRREQQNFNLKLQFSNQPNIQYIELSCMNRYARTFADSSELNTNYALTSIQKIIDAT